MKNIEELIARTLIETGPAPEKYDEVPDGWREGALEEARNIMAALAREAEESREELVEVFRRGWDRANVRGKKGQRVSTGLDDVFTALFQQDSGVELPQEIGAMIRFPSIANVFVRISTWMPFPWTDGAAFLSDRDIQDRVKTFGQWVPADDDREPVKLVADAE